MSSKTVQNEQVSGDGSTARRINNLLNSSKTRTEGLQLLNSFLPQCPDEDFLQFCISWMQNCCKVDGLARNRDFIIHLLNDLFKTSANYPELKKSVSFFITTRFFDFFFKHFLHSQSGWSCTLTCMLSYRGACGPFQENLEKYLKAEAGRNRKISSKVVHCYALLPSVGGGGNEGICYKKNWRTYFAKFLSIVHSLLNDLFADVEELQVYETPEHVYVKDQNENTPANLTMQIHNYCSILSCMLLCEYPAPKSVPTDLVFQLLCRGLAVTPKALAKRPTSDILSLVKVLPEAHRSLLCLLKALIVACKSHLLPYARLVCKLIGQTLEWSESEFASGKEKPIGCLRESAYEVLCNWVAATGNGSCAEDISNVVISNAVSDVLSEKKVVFLKEAKHQNRSKNWQRTQYRMSAVANARLCHSALKALQFLLKFAGVSLKPEEHKFLQEFVVKLIVQVQKSGSDVKPPPFDVPSCRLELYALLLELTLHPCPKWPPPTHFALRLLQRGLSDACPRIATSCATALSMMTIIIHPQYNNGGFLPCETPGRTDRREVQLQWKQTSDREKLCTVEEEMEISSGLEVCQTPTESARSPVEEITSKEIVITLGEDSRGSSSGDSSTTVVFTKIVSDSGNESLVVAEREKKNDALGYSEDQPSPEVQKTATEDEPGVEVQKTATEDEPGVEVQKTATEDQPSPEVQKTTTEDQPSPEVQKTATEDSSAGDQQEPTKEPEDKLEEPGQSTPKTSSPEPASEEGHLKKRYFLRSKTKGSSEEPEEAMKRAVSLDSPKSTPVRSSSRGSPSVPSSAKRPRTRASSRAETNGDAESTAFSKRTGDDDDDILATFHDSFLE